MMLVNAKSARKCRKNCDGDYGHSNNSKAKKNLKRTIRRRESRNWKRECI